MHKIVSLTAILVSIISNSSNASKQTPAWVNSAEPPRQKMQVSSETYVPATGKKARAKQEQAIQKISEEEARLDRLREEADLIIKQKQEAEQTLADFQAYILQNQSELQKLKEQKTSDQRVLEENAKQKSALEQAALQMEAEKRKEEESLQQLMSQNIALQRSIQSMEQHLALQLSASDSINKTMQVAEEAQAVNNSNVVESKQALVMPAELGGNVASANVSQTVEAAQAVVVADKKVEVTSVNQKVDATAPTAPVIVEKKVDAATSESDEVRGLVQINLASAPISRGIGYLTQAYYFVNNNLSRAWTSEKDRYAPGTYPPLTYVSVLNTLKSKWFPKKTEPELLQLSKKDMHFSLQPIHFSSAQHPGGYFVPVGVTCGKLTIEISDSNIRKLIVGSDKGTLEEKSKQIYLAYIKSLKTANEKFDMAAYNPNYDDQESSLKPYEFYLAMRPYLDEQSDNQPFYRDIQFCRRPNHTKHGYTLLTLRLLAFDDKKGYAVHWSIYGYRVDHKIPEETLQRFVMGLQQFENDDWLVKLGV